MYAFLYRTCQFVINISIILENFISSLVLHIVNCILRLFRAINDLNIKATFVFIHEQCNDDLTMRYCIVNNHVILLSNLLFDSNLYDFFLLRTPLNVYFQ